MTNTQFTDLLAHGEATWLDWKRELPVGLYGGKSDPSWDKSKGELLKDIVALANGSDGRDDAFLVFGVQDEGTARKVTGIRGGFDDAMFQTWSLNSFAPPPTFSYVEIGHDGFIVGIAIVKRAAPYPHVASANVGGILHEGQVWYRRGTKNSVAGHEDLQRMFLGEQPAIFPDDKREPVSSIIQQIYADGWSPVLPLAHEKHGRIASGYEVVYLPNTRREIWVGPKHELKILMRRRNSG